MTTKTFTASNIPEGLARIKEEMGAQAVVIQSERLLTGGVCLTASLQPVEQQPSVSVDRLRNFFTDSFFSFEFQQSFWEHLKTTQGFFTLNDLTLALSSMFSFSTLAFEPMKRAFMFVGPFGGGKTTVLSKIAVASKLGHKKTAVLTLDTRKAGALQQLSGVLDLLKIPLTVVQDEKVLPDLLLKYRIQETLILMDTPGIDPFKVTDIGYLANVKNISTGVEPVLVLPATINATAALKMGKVFSKIGCTRIIVTQTDMIPDFTAVLDLAFQCKMQLCYIADSVSVTKGLKSFTATDVANYFWKAVQHEDK